VKGTKGKHKETREPCRNTTPNLGPTIYTQKKEGGHKGCGDGVVDPVEKKITDIRSPVGRGKNGAKTKLRKEKICRGPERESK